MSALTLIEVNPTPSPLITLNSEPCPLLPSIFSERDLGALGFRLHNVPNIRIFIIVPSRLQYRTSASSVSYLRIFSIVPSRLRLRVIHCRAATSGAHAHTNSSTYCDEMSDATTTLTAVDVNGGYASHRIEQPS